MKRVKNPFIVSGKIEPEYFCDRVEESARLIKSLTNGNNLVLISPRRMGKTGLVQFCYDKPEISDNYYTVFIDILHTTSLREFTFLFGKSIFESIMPLGQKMLTTFVQTLRSLSGKFSVDLVTNMPCIVLKKVDRLNCLFTTKTGNAEPSLLVLKSVGGSMPPQAFLTV